MRWPRSLKGKLALVMVLAALLPLATVSVIAIPVAIGHLESGLRARAQQTSRISMNLLLRQVYRISAETRRLASTSRLLELLSEQRDEVASYLAGYPGTLHSVLVAVVDTKGEIVGHRTPLEPEFVGFQPAHNEALVRRALNYEHFVTIDMVGERLAILAAAPVIDEHFVVRGAVVMGAPFGEELAGFVKGVVQAEVGFIVEGRPVASTFAGAAGQRLPGVRPPADLARAVRRGVGRQTVRYVGGREYQLSFSRLQTVDGRPVGMMVIGLDRSGLVSAQRSATVWLGMGAAGAAVFALMVALVLGQRITTPLSQLQRRAQAIAAGDLRRELAINADDEIGDLARSFRTMIVALRENRERLDARIRELSTLHQISRAVGSVLSLDEVLRLVTSEVTQVLGAETGALLLREEDGLVLRSQVGLPEAASAAASAAATAAASAAATAAASKGELPPPWRSVAEEAIARHWPARGERVLAVPLETRERVVGALVIGRPAGQRDFTEGDVRLLATFAGQAASAIDNARLYAEVMAFSEQLERQVQVRTAELQAANEELGHTIAELKETQGQLIHSERMAGLGSLVAGVAHEINTPAAAIQGAGQILGETFTRMLGRIQMLAEKLPATRWSALLRERVARDRSAQVRPPAEVRRRARDLANQLEREGVPDARRMARRLVEAEAEPLVQRVIELRNEVDLDLVVGLLEDLAYLQRSASSIQTAIAAVVRIVQALRSYAHADRESLSEVDITDGLETTLTILHNELRYGINVVTKYARLPRVAVYVDDLNQVWTNLIHNAVQAMEGKGEIVIETFVDGDDVGVRITDNGPGVPPEVLPRIFEPFFSTKPRGEGTGLGMSIARKIIEKHGGQIAVESRPGRTAFTVTLPVAGPPAARREKR